MRCRSPVGLDTARQASVETHAGPGFDGEPDEPCAKMSRPGRSVMSHVATEQRRRDKINEGYVQLAVQISTLVSVAEDCCCSRFGALRELIPHKDKMDKATFLQQAVEYIRQLQVGLQLQLHCARYRLPVFNLFYTPAPFVVPPVCASQLWASGVAVLQNVCNLLQSVLRVQAVMHQLISLGAVKTLPDELQWSIRMLLPRQEQTNTQASPANQAAQKPFEPAVSQMVPSSAYLPYMLQPQQMAMLTQHAQEVGCASCITSVSAGQLAYTRFAVLEAWTMY